MFSEALLHALAKRVDERYPLQHDVQVKPLAYGTAGFRTTGALLPPVAARVVAIAVLRAWFCENQKMAMKHSATCSVGFMITASHNPAVDNGFKVIDTDGGMLASSWEHWCTEAANASTGAELVAVIRKCAESVGVSKIPETTNARGVLFIGRDTRDSGVVIENAAADILHSVLEVPFTSFGVLTTPQLHFLVAEANKSSPSANQIDVDSYHEQVLSSFEELFRVAVRGSEVASKAPHHLVVDCANGVGAIGMKRLLAFSKSRSKGDVISKYLNISLINTNIEDATLLNCECGADFAKLHATPSEAMKQWSSSENIAEKAHFYCLDGDADRIVAFVYASEPSRQWVLLDGDRISILYAMLLHKWLGEKKMKELDVGVVQTAYANGASTEFLEKQLHMTVYIAATGVKNLHPVAHACDIGVYFEANGHGTVLFSDKVASGSPQSQVAEASRLLVHLRNLLSQVCGDAIADMLMCEVALQALDMSFADWASLYTDRPCKQVKVTVEHPKRITNTKDEQRALSPDGMQNEIDAAVSATLAHSSAARSFVRPSGTEPIVRVYAEASTPEACNSLTAQVCSIVEKYCN